MSSHIPESLDTEERALAQRLARLGASGEPSPSLDARILAAAHDAAVKLPTAQMQRRPRWPVAFGVAASLALAVGVAWQLRPLPQAPVYEESSPSVAMDAATAGGGPSADAAGIQSEATVLPPPAAEPAMEREASRRDETGNAQAKAAVSDGDDAAGAAAEAQAPIVFDAQPSADAAPSPPPPPPPAAAATSTTPEFVPAPRAPTAPPVEQRARVEQAARASNAQSRPAPVAAPQPGNQAENDVVLRDAAASAEAGSEEGFDERPPNTADAPEVRQAWLQRIRELINSGDTTAARDSLQEFKRRYPGVTLPEDLRRFDKPL